MSTTDDVIRALEGYVRGERAPEERELYDMLHRKWAAADDRLRAVPAMYALLERFPDADFGSPGPVVHALEAIDGYSNLLRESLRRRPAPLTVWMINRILNVTNDTGQRSSWMRALVDAAEHPEATSNTREEARFFVRHQLHERG